MAYTKYSLTPANNTAAPPDGAPEGMLPSAVNDTMRDMMAQIRDVGDGVRDGTYTMTAPKITGGTITGVTLTGNTLTNPVITGATLTTSAFNGTVGATTASTGAFTTINASTSITNAGLTSGRVTYAGASGLLSDNANFVFNGTSLGVGTASPDALLDVTRSGNGQIAVLQTSASRGFSFDSQSDTALQIASIQGSTNMDLWANTLSFSAGATERMRLDSSGNLLVGTTTPVFNASGRGLITINGSSAAAVGFTASGVDKGIILHTGTDMIMSNSVSGAITFQTNNTERMRIDSAGNLGLGVTPSATGSGARALQLTNYGTLSGNGNTGFMSMAANAYESADNSWNRVNATSAGRYQISYTGEHSWYYTGSSTAGSAITWTQAMTLDASGNLLVGVTNTAHTSAGFTVEAGGVPYTTRGSGGTLMGFYNLSASTIGSITNSSDVAVLYNTTSDQRLKTNIVNAPSGNIDDIKVRSFDWIASESHQKYGMVAQELIEVAPYAVYQPENPEEMMAVDYSKLVPMMIKEIQDLKQRIETLENK
jgi:hypothetical protein